MVMVLPLRYSAKQIAVARVILQESAIVPANHEIVFRAMIDLGINPEDYEGSLNSMKALLKK